MAVTFYRTLTLALFDAGVVLLAGTDTPNPLLIPGFSLHHEMAALSRAGIDNMDVLAMATINAAKHLGIESEVGEIKKGFRADLVLLRENPLINLEALKAVEGVVLNGRWLDRSSIDRLFHKVAEKREL